MKFLSSITLQRTLFFMLSFAIIWQGCNQKPREESKQVAEGNVTKIPNASEDGNWIVLFDGASVDQWRGYQQDSFPDSGWIIEDGALRCIGTLEGEDARDGRDIMTREKFDDFELELEWKISESGNSGILLMAQEIEDQPIWRSAPEMQILDDENHPDAKMGVGGNHKSGSLYDLITADPLNAKPFGEWNSVRIVKKDSTVRFFMNGEQIVDFQLWTDEWNEMVANSKFADFEPFAKTSDGHIGLQDHWNDVWFRNIRIRRL